MTPSNRYIVCGFYTADYSLWMTGLSESLIRHRQPHEFMPTEKAPGGWEANTLRKAAELRRAMDRHPDKVIVWLDVDCLVRGDLSPLADLSGDVAVYMNGRRRRNGGYKMHCISRTIVLKPTQGARDFVDNWIELSEHARYGDVDQMTFLLAMGLSVNTSFQPLERKWSAVVGDAGGIVLHDQASNDARKVGRVGRWLGAMGVRLDRNADHGAERRAS